MPELPEVETVRIGLTKLVRGKVIARVTFDTEKSFPNSSTDVNQFLVGAEIIHVRRRAKVLILDLNTHYSLIIHLKMTGQLVFVGKQRFGAGHPNDSLIHALPDTSTRVVLHFSDSSNLYFNDQRKFGWVRLIPTAELPFIDFMKKLGPEPLEADFTHQVFVRQLTKRSKSRIKPVLLDQTVLAGVGNIYADESLWAAKIHPSTKVHDITKAKRIRLYQELIAVLRLSLQKGGSTDRTYVNAEGKKGSYISFAQVFRKEGKSCSRCGDTIIKIRVAGRGTHICPTCQKERS